MVVLAVAVCGLVAACGEKATAPRSAASVAAADIDAASPLDRPYRLKGGEALDVDRLFELLPLYLRPTYKTAAFDAALGATVVSDLRVGESPAGFVVGRAEFYGVDLERIEKLKAAVDTSSDAPLERVIERLRLFEIASLDPAAGAQKTTIGAVEIDSLRVREGGLPKEPAGSGVAAFFNAFDVAGIYVKDARTTGDDNASSTSGAAFDFAAGDLRLVGLGGGRLGALVGRDLDYNVQQSPAAMEAASRGLGPGAEALINGPLRNFIAVKNQRTKIETLEWRDISFAGLMEYGLKGERPPISAQNLIDLGTAHFENVETFIGEKRFSMTPETTISAMEFSWLAPSKIRAVARGGVFDFTAFVADAESDALDALRSRGFDQIRADSDFGYDWSSDRGEAVVSAGFDSQGFVDFDFDAAFEGLELQKIDAARGAGGASPAFDLAKLKSFSVVLVDEKMLDGFYALAALESGGSAEDMRAAAPAMLRLGKLELQRENPRMGGYVEAVARFLEEGGTLTIKAAPDAPVPLAAIATAGAGGPDAIAETLNLTVTQKK